MNQSSDLEVVNRTEKATQGSRSSPMMATKNEASLEPHHHDAAHRIVRHEMGIILIYATSYITLDLGMNLLEWNTPFFSEFLFCGFIFMSVCHDLHFEAKLFDTIVLQEKNHVLLKLVVALSCLIVAFAFTYPSQFWMPVELEVVKDEELHSVAKGERFTVWNFVYGGYNNNGLQQLGRNNGMGLSEKTRIEDENGSISTVEDVGIRSVIHVTVGATKFTVVRLLISEAELTVKMLIKFYWGM